MAGIIIITFDAHVETDQGYLSWITSLHTSMALNFHLRQQMHGSISFTKAEEALFNFSIKGSSTFKHLRQKGYGTRISLLKLS
jgi:hypothetical protein